jgi:(2S)-methylsuccinyl-CoA dehydrogenase
MAIENWPPQLEGAVLAAERYAEAALAALRVRLEGSDLDTEQRAAHGYAWVETSVAGARALADWLAALERRGAAHEAEQILAAIAVGEILSQLLGGLPMGQNEIVRPSDLGAEAAAEALASNPAVRWVIANGNTAAHRAQLVRRLRDGAAISDRFDDELLDAIRDQYRRFTDERIIPHAHGWHLANALIPDETIAEMAALGTFGVCIPESYGGLGLGKLVMCVVTEELSRGWIGAGSLGTRSEIAGELIVLGGTEAQKTGWLPKIASGEVLPTAVFTEPDTGSDMASLATQALRSAEGWVIRGAKTWITHAARTDLMTLLARTRPEVKGYGGLSMLLVPKPRGSQAAPFPAEGMSGSEIEVLGYRGMREYALQFDDMKAPADALLGGEEGQGFKQLMRTFEGARIQTAARAVGVARRAFDLAFQYACDRKQFGRPIIEFPRVSDKLAMMLVEMVTARELTYFAARAKDAGRRCDIEAGMAKLHAARTAWANADAGLQIHGGNGYALEYEISRVLCDARILNIFEGAAEIQAQVIARGRLQAG